MKLIKRLIILILLAVLVIGTIAVVVFGIPGYKMYKNALEKTPIDEKVASIEEKKNYAEYADLPEMYINAVIATEDHRFYDHRGIDYISVIRAIYNDVSLCCPSKIAHIVSSPGFGNGCGAGGFLFISLS